MGLDPTLSLNELLSGVVVCYSHEAIKITGIQVGNILPFLLTLENDNWNVQVE